MPLRFQLNFDAGHNAELIIIVEEDRSPVFIKRDVEYGTQDYHQYKTGSQQ